MFSRLKASLPGGRRAPAPSTAQGDGVTTEPAAREEASRPAVAAAESSQVLGGAELVRWQLATEARKREQEELQRSREEQTGAQRRQVVELLRENEQLAMQTQQLEVANRGVEENLALTREEVEKMARNLGRVGEQVRLIKDVRAGATAQQEDREEVVREMQESFRQLEVSGQAKLRHLENEVARTEAEGARMVREERGALQEVEREMRGLEGRGEEVDKKILNLEREMEVTEEQVMEQENMMKQKREQLEKVVARNAEVKTAVFASEGAWKLQKEESARATEAALQTLQQLELEISAEDTGLLDTAASVTELEGLSAESKESLAGMKTQLAELQVREANLLEEGKLQDKEMAEQRRKKELYDRVKKEVEESAKGKLEEEKKLSVMKQIQKEKFGAEEENVQLGGRVHVLRDEVLKLAEVTEDMKLEVTAKTQELQDLRTQSSSLIIRKEQFQAQISELQLEANSAREELSCKEKGLRELEDRVRKEQEEEAEVTRKCAELERAIEKHVTENDIVVESIKDKENSIGNKVAMGAEVEAKIKAAEFSLESTNQEDKALKVQLEAYKAEMKSKVNARKNGEGKVKKVLKDEMKLRAEVDSVLKKIENIDGKSNKVEAKMDQEAVLKASLVSQVKQMKDEHKDLLNKVATNEKISEKSIELKKAEKMLKQTYGKMTLSKKKTERLEKQKVKSTDLLQGFVHEDQNARNDITNKANDISSFLKQIKDTKSAILTKEEEFKTMQKEETVKEKEKDRLGEQMKGLELKKQLAMQIELQNQKKEKEYTMVLKEKKRDSENILAQMMQEYSKLEKKVEESQDTLSAKSKMKEQLVLKEQKSALQQQELEKESKSLDKMLQDVEAAIEEASRKPVLPSPSPSRRVLQQSVPSTPSRPTIRTMSTSPSPSRRAAQQSVPSTPSRPSLKPTPASPSSLSRSTLRTIPASPSPSRRAPQQPVPPTTPSRPSLGAIPASPWRAPQQSAPTTPSRPSLGSIPASPLFRRPQVPPARTTVDFDEIMGVSDMSGDSD